MFQTFLSFDLPILNYFHQVYLQTGGFLTPIMKVISMFAKFGICMIAIAVLLALFKKTRKMGIACGISMIIGAILVNGIIKNVAGRVRPYNQVSEIGEWFNAMGLTAENDWSFPSGHVNITTIVMVSIFMCSKHKKITWLCLLVIPVMAFSRLYLLYHYPTDVLFAMLFGTVSAVAGFFITKLLYKKWFDAKNNKFTIFVRDFSVVSLFKEDDGNGNYVDENEDRDFLNDVNPKRKESYFTMIKNAIANKRKIKKEQEQEQNQDQEK